MAHKQGADRSGSEDLAGYGAAPHRTLRALRANHQRKKGRSVLERPFVFFYGSHPWCEKLYGALPHTPPPFEKGGTKTLLSGDRRKRGREILFLRTTATREVPARATRLRKSKQNLFTLWRQP